MMNENERSNGGRWSFTAYAVATLVLVGLATVATGGSPDLAAGMLGAWGVQLLAFRPLSAALSGRRDATRAWLGGIALRVAGLIVAGGFALAGAAGSDLPVAYGIATTVLLLIETGWLFARLPRTGRAEGGSPVNHDRLEGTSATG